MFLPSGTFELRIEGNQLPANGAVMGIPPLQLIARSSVTVAQGPVNGLQMMLKPMATIDVEVTEERVAKRQANGQAAAPPQGPQYIPISLVSTDTQSYAMAYPAERPDRPGHPQIFSPGNAADGPLVIHNVPPGKYLLQAGTQPPWYVASAFCGGVDLTREPLVIAGSATGCSINVVLRDDAASLKVSVLNAEGSRAAPAFVYVIPLNNLTRDAQTFTTSPDGKLAIDGIAPGEYLLLAMHRSDPLAFRDAESLRRYEAEGKRIELAPGAGADVQLDLVDEEP